MGIQPAPSPRRPLESYVAAVEDLVGQIIRHGGFALSIAVRKEESAEAPGSPTHVVDFSGADRDLLLERNAALLDALETVVLKAVRLDEDHFGRITFDCAGWRQTRVEELKLMARVAAERVVETGDPFPLNPMTARERRIVHLALKDLPQVRTQSEGYGPERKVVIVKS
jgi:predicted RNA-binding protein Jag